MDRIKTTDPPKESVAAPRLLQDRARFTGVDAALLLVVLIWGSNFVVMKITFDALHPFAFNVVRLSLAAVILILALWWKEGWQSIPKRDWLKLIGLGLLGNTFYQIPFVAGLNLTTAGNSALLIATIPVWSALLARVLGWERITPRMWLGIFLSFLGVILVTVASPNGFSLNSSGFLGDLLTLVAAVCWAGYTVFSKDLLKRYSPLRVSTLALLPGVTGLWLVSLPSVLQTDWSALSPGVWTAVLYSGVFPIAVAYVIWATGVQRAGAARTAVYNNLVPVVTFLLAYLVLSQPMAPLQLLGGAVVLVGVWLTVRSD
jgi:drug/metabolite transporter (DMT)-like permease